jgi:hypothetical protein
MVSETSRAKVFVRAGAWVERGEVMVIVMTTVMAMVIVMMIVIVMVMVMVMVIAILTFVLSHGWSGGRRASVEDIRAPVSLERAVFVLFPVVVEDVRVQVMVMVVIVKMLGVLLFCTAVEDVRRQAGRMAVPGGSNDNGDGNTYGNNDDHGDGDSVRE